METVDYFAVRDKGAMCRLFVIPHEAAIAVDVGDSMAVSLRSKSPTSMHHQVGGKTCQIVEIKARSSPPLKPKPLIEIESHPHMHVIAL